MSKILVAYESKYGNTKRVGETIVEGIRGAAGTEAVLGEAKHIDFNSIPSFDAIVIGGPTHFGGPTRGVKKFINQLRSIPLEGKQYAVFDTYLGGDFEKGVKKMESLMSESAPAMTRAIPGLSIKVEGMKGPIVEGELVKCKEFGLEIASKLAAAV